MSSGKKKVILGIDGSNLAFRYLSIPNPTYPPLVAMMNDISMLSRKTNAVEIFIAWEGVRSRNPRRQIFPDYKSNRDNQDRAKDYRIKDIKKQIEKFDHHVGKVLPVRQLRIDFLEADDGLALMAKHYYNKSDEYVIILSSTDQDYYQLINDRVFIWNSKRKQLVTKIDMLREFGLVNPENFAWFKAIGGDTSDNIPGIKGVGPKTCQKLFADILHSLDRWTWDDVRKRLQAIKKPFRPEDIESFYRIVQLQEVLHPTGLLHFQNIIKETEYKEFDEKSFCTEMALLHEGFSSYSSKYLYSISAEMNNFSIRRAMTINEENTINGTVS
jgi:5'-3' exonuclease